MGAMLAGIGIGFLLAYVRNALTKPEKPNLWEAILGFGFLIAGIAYQLGVTFGYIPPSSYKF
jgi:hypothetical protein